MDKIFHANDNQKREKVAILMPDKIDVQSKSVRKDKEKTKKSLHTMIKRSTHQENTVIANICATQH